MKHLRPLVALVITVAATVARAQTPPAAKKPEARPAARRTYDSPTETRAKTDAFWLWAGGLRAQLRGELAAQGMGALQALRLANVQADKAEFARVQEIVGRIPRHRVTYQMYDEIVIDSYAEHRTQTLSWVVLSFGAVPKEVSRTSIGGQEVVVQMWQNTDGSNVTITFSDSALVAKAQSGLQ